MKRRPYQLQASEAERRATYEAFAETLCSLVSVKTTNVDERTFEAVDDICRNTGQATLSDALLAHFMAITDTLDWNDPRTIRTLYVEMRLLSDEAVAKRGGVQ